MLHLELHTCQLNSYETRSSTRHSMTSTQIRRVGHFCAASNAALDFQHKHPNLRAILRICLSCTDLSPWHRTIKLLSENSRSESSNAIAMLLAIHPPSRMRGAGFGLPNKAKQKNSAPVKCEMLPYGLTMVAESLNPGSRTTFLMECFTEACTTSSRFRSWLLAAS